MIKEEIKSLFHNKLLLVVLAAIILIPSIYAGLFLSSMWDPYGDLEYLPVAVVNKDIPVTYNEKELSIGKELTKELSENSSMAFNIVDEATAYEGLQNGTYYMTITIPEDFSECASTVMDDEPKQMTLQYATNPGKNYISMKLSESAIKQIKENIMTEVTKTYTETVFASLDQVVDGFDQAAAGTLEMLEGEDKLITGNQEITDNLGTLADGTKTLKEGTDKLQTGIKDYTEGATKINDGASKLNDGASKLNESMPAYTDGVATASKGANQLASNNQALNNGVNTVVNGVSDLNDGTKKIEEGLKSMESGLNKSLSAENVNSLNTAMDGLVTLDGYIKQLNNAVNGENNALSGLSASLTSVGDYTKGTGEDIKNAGDNLTKAGDNVKNVADSALSIAGNLENAGAELPNAGASLTSTGANIKAAGEATAEAGNNLTKTGEKVTNAATDIGTVLAYIQATGGTAPLTPNEIGLLKDALSSLYDPTGASTDNAATYLALTGNNAKSIGENLTSAGTNLNNAATNITNTGNYLSQMATDLTNIKTELTNAQTNMLATGTNLTDAGTKLTASGEILTALSNSDGISTLQTSVAQIADGADKLLIPASNGMKSMLGGLSDIKNGLEMTEEKNGKSGLLEGISKVNNGMNSLYTGVAGENGLQKGIKNYTDGVTTLNSGLNELASHNTELNQGVSQLNNGTNELLKGSNTLIANNNKLITGAADLNDGAGKLYDGANKLADGSNQLGEGLLSLQDGTNQLNTALTDGADEVRSNQATDKNIDMFVNPVTTNETMITTVENNGHAMAAYMLSVGLWVGCLAFCLMYPLVEYKGQLKNGIAWWASKAIIAYPIAIIMAIASIGILHIFLGFEPVNVLRTLLVACMAAITFMSIMYFFNILLGKVGSFLMLIFMVLQLTGSAGTYPIEISGDLANKLHKYMPFTYTVDSFRSAISGGGNIQKELIILASLTIIFTLLTITVFEIREKLIEHNKKPVYEWIEEKGLA